MKTKWTLLDVPVDSIQAFGCRSARLSGKPSRHNYKLDSSARGLRVLSPRAAATLTPASVVTSRPQIRDGEHLEARLGPLGRSLVQQVEVITALQIRSKLVFPVLIAASSQRQGRR